MIVREDPRRRAPDSRPSPLSHRVDEWRGEQQGELQPRHPLRVREGTGVTVPGVGGPAESPFHGGVVIALALTHGGGGRRPLWRQRNGSDADRSCSQNDADRDSAAEARRAVPGTRGRMASPRQRLSEGLPLPWAGGLNPGDPPKKVTE
jgi:hypothetical protein